MEQMHKEKSDMRKKMQQIIRDSQPQLKNNRFSPKQDSKTEHMQSS